MKIINHYMIILSTKHYGVHIEQIYYHLRMWRGDIFRSRMSLCVSVCLSVML